MNVSATSPPLETNMRKHAATPVSQPERAKCMEVWGGNGETESCFEMPGLNVWVWRKPHGRPGAGGDLHYLSSCASGRITRMMVADVCGQDNVFTDLAIQLRDLMMQNVNDIKQDRFVREMHRRLRGIANRGGFATALISTYFAPTKTLDVCNAGHPAPFVYRERENRWSVCKRPRTELPACDEPLPGVVEAEEYQHFNTKMEKGDMLLSYSNELTECRDDRGQILGVDGILDRVSQLDCCPAKLVSSLVTKVVDEHPDNFASNDVSIVLCQAAKRSVGWKNNLLAPFRLLGSVSDNTELK